MRHEKTVSHVFHFWANGAVKFVNRPLVILIIAVIAVAVVGLVRGSMLDALVVGLGVTAAGGVWLALSDKRFRRGYLGLYTAGVTAVASLIMTGYLMRNSIGERLVDSAAVLIFIFTLLPMVLGWVSKRRERSKSDHMK